MWKFFSKFYIFLFLVKITIPSDVTEDKYDAVVSSHKYLKKKKKLKLTVFLKRQT